MTTVLLYIVSWMPLAICLLGIFRVKKYHDPVVIILIICLLAFLLELHGMTMFFGIKIQRIALNLYSYLYFVLILFYYYLNLNKRGNANILLRISILAAALCLAAITFLVDNIQQCAVWSWQIESIIIIVYSIYILISEGIDTTKPIGRNSVFWIALAMLVFNAGSILEYTLRPYVLQSGYSQQIFQIILLQSLFIGLATYLLIIKGVWEMDQKTR